MQQMSQNLQGVQIQPGAQMYQVYAPPLYTPAPAPVQQPVPQPTPVQQPVPQELRVYLTETRNEFSAHMCTCCLNDAGVCIQGCLCPCWLFGKNIEHSTGESCAKNCLCYVLCCGPCNHASHRRRLRLKYNLKNDCCGDCCNTVFCPCCSLIQDARELRYQDSKPRKQFMV
jgi:Cys-rich protein (TIGR01571 family)